MDELSQIDEMGVIHGRFQVLHNDHLKYLMAGFRLCRHLVVGITNPDPYLTREDKADPLRSDLLSNPLTYFERYLMVKAVLREKRLSPERFSVVPLPINLPELYKYYVPMDAVFFLTIYDDWGRKKLELFESLGLKTHVLWEVPPERKGISGRNLRLRMLEGRSWEPLIPKSVADLMKAWDIPSRLRIGKT
ncbi:MAG: nicotinate-nucleotide adenylyltransferase [Deltaproteobacteria bacterium]|nr:nicotinate-nucleotide adenylyltransferase [Deltaproteobacteria bacterium]